MEMLESTYQALFGAVGNSLKTEEQDLEADVLTEVEAR